AAKRTSRTLQSLGIAYLVTGDVGRAVSVLEEAVDSATSDSRVLSDLAAAYLARAVRTNRPQDLARAVTMADRAVKADARLAEALFNRACALEGWSLVDEARRAWQDSLGVDSTSGWATEARARLAALRGSSQSRPSDEARLAVALASSDPLNQGDLAA